MPALRSKVLKVLLGAGHCILLVMAVNIHFKGRVPRGVYLADTYLGGKSYREVETFLEEKRDRLKKEQINIYITAGENPLVFSLEELGLTLAKEKLMREITNLKYSFNFKEMYRFFTHSVYIPGHFNFEEERLMTALGPVQAEKYVPPQNATIRAEEGKLRLNPSQKGRRLKIEKTGEEILEKLFCWPSFPLTIYMETEWLFPKKTILHILNMGIREEIATASTFNPRSKQSSQYHAGSREIDNIILAPGNSFSFNQIVGEANLKNGYQEAPIIVHERVVPGPGREYLPGVLDLYHAAL